MPAFRQGWLSLVVWSAWAVGCAGGADVAKPNRPVRVATWNVHEGFTVDGIKSRTSDLAAFGSRIHPDVLVMEEVVSPEVVKAVRDAMGLHDYHIAVSDFNPADPGDFTGLEVAVLSRFPITQAIEYDPTPDNHGKPNSLPELPIMPLAKLGMTTPEQDEQIRGFLWVRIDALRLTVVGVHLKSSRGADGEEDVENAVRREFIAAAVVDSVAQDLRLFPGYTTLVAGDFNVGHSDPKNGVDPAKEDLTPSPTSDGYDETHAMFGGGLLGIKMRNLSGNIRESTYPGINSTPIDNIYVLGATADRFSPAQLEHETFGSDHRPVFADWTVQPATTATPVPSFAHASTTGRKPAASTTGHGVGPRAPITPAEVAKNLNGYATVEFVVRAANIQPSTPPIGFLNSEADYRSADNFTAVVFDEGLAKFRAIGVTDIVARFQNKRVRVSGTISERRGKYQIVVSEPTQIEIVK